VGSPGPGEATLNDELPIAPLIPPDTVAREPIPTLPVPALPTIRHATDLLIGVAAVSHSGRVRDQALLDALSWAPGDRHSVDLLDSTILVRRTPTGPYSINTRGQVFLPTGLRDLLVARR
jgi:hypothetical protein